MKLSLPPKEVLVNTNDEDPLKYYYIPAVGSVYKKRLKNTLKLLGSEKKYGTLLEIGFGSGLLFPELMARCNKLFGLESHEVIPEVKKRFDSIGIRTELTQGSLLKMPYAENQFDAVVCVSTYEHIPELDVAMKELHRVMKPGGVAILSFPVRNIITDTFFRAAGFDPRKLHPSSHRDIVMRRANI